MPTTTSEIRLTPTSFIILGTLAQTGEATPYELKAMVAQGVGDLWSVQHAQLYREPERLARAGYLHEKVERAGRRRKHYRLTAAGKQALEAWLAEPTGAFTDLRDPGLLQLFFGAEPRPLARVQHEVHKKKLAEYEELRRHAGDQLPEGPRLALESGIGHEREWVRFWKRLVS